MINEHAIVHPGARIAKNVSIGPWTIIGDDVEIDEGTWVGPHVVVKGATKIGKNNKIFQFASVGDDPQDKKYAGEKTKLEIGNNNVIREYCTINRGTVQGGGITSIGHNNLLMAYVHVAHDCYVGDEVIFSNSAQLAGHVTVGNCAVLSAFSGAHQFCVIGDYSFIASGTLLGKDVPPYFLVAGMRKAAAYGLNFVGLKRRGFDKETIAVLRNAYKTIYQKGLTLNDAIAELKTIKSAQNEIKVLIDFLNKSERGIVRCATNEDELIS